MKQKNIQHLYWRLSFGLDIKDLAILKLKSKSKIISKLFFDSKSFTPLELNLQEFSKNKNKSYKEFKKEFSETELQEIKNDKDKK